MQQHQKLTPHPQATRPAATPGPDTAPPRAQHLEDIAARIERLLSGDSRAFLEATRQTGGE